MATWSSRGLRGSSLEDLLNKTNEIYREKHLALVQKIPTPITPVEMDSKSRHITLAYFDQKSTVDYIGVVQGIPVCFDAKECKEDTFPLANIHEHQMNFMKDFEAQEGIAFFLINFTDRREYYYLRYSEAESYFEREKKGGRKSFTYEEMDKSFRVRKSREVPLHYLEQLEAYLERIEEYSEAQDY